MIRPAEVASSVTVKMNGGVATSASLKTWTRAHQVLARSFRSQGRKRAASTPQP